MLLPLPLLALAAAQVASSSASPPLIELLTFGVGSDPFSHFGHAGICLRERGLPGGQCMNFGTADFSTPLPLTLGFLRGEAAFWVSVLDRERTIDWYAAENRTVERQILPLSNAEAAALVSALIAAAAPEVRYYRYHHFNDNCTTRIRDLLDQAIGGRLSATTKTTPSGRTFRAFIEEGFKDHVLLLALSHLFIGRAADRPASEWEAMFLPSAFRDSVERILGARPETLFHSSRIDVPTRVPAGHLAILSYGTIAAFLISVSRTKRYGPWLRALLVGIPGLLGLCAALIALYAIQEELVWNEALLVITPLEVLALRTDRLGRWWRRGRMGLMGVIAVLGLSGVLLQPLWSSLIAMTLILGALEIALAPQAQRV